MKKLYKRNLVFATVTLSLLFFISILLPTRVNAASKRVKLSQTKITLTVGKTRQLTVKGITKRQSKKIKWTSSKKSIATVSKSGKVRARKVGKTSIIAKVGKKKLKCVVISKKKKKVIHKNNNFYDDDDERSEQDICKPKRSQLYKTLGINSSTKPQYAAFLLAKWVCDHVSYGNSRTIGVYDALKTGKGIGTCGGYTELYNFLLKGLGIETRDTAMEYPEYFNDFGHTYTQLKIDEEWYGVDVTCMDQADSIPDCEGDEGVRYDMTQFLVPGKYLAFESKNRGANSTRFLKAIYDSNVAYNKNFSHVDDDLKEIYTDLLCYDERFGGYVDKDDKDLVRLYTDKDGTIVWKSRTNYLKYWDNNKNFIGNIQNKGNPQFDEHDYRFNPWFTGEWKQY